MKEKNPTTIMIVDDNPANLDMLFQYFEHSGVKTLAAQDGESALLQLEHVQPDLILLDVLMPGIDGFETCRRLKANGVTQDIPVIFMSALSETVEKVKGFEVGGVDYVTKPFRYEEVVARVNAHLTIREHRQKLQEQAILLAEKNIQLQELNASKDKFFSLLAHDLKNPFAGLFVTANLIKDNIARWSKDEARGVADELQKTVSNLYAFLENLLTWSQFQQGLIAYQPQFVNLQFLVARNVALCIQHAQQKQITLRNSIQEPLPVYLDVNMIDVVMLNLLSNAIKFTKTDGAVEISATQDEDTVAVAVADTGIGISAEKLADLFRIDARTRRIGTADEQGTGLGLILCKAFVEQHGGAIWVESEVGRGSTFRFTIPRRHA